MGEKDQGSEGQDAEDILRELVLAIDADVRKPGSDGRITVATMDVLAKAAHFLNIP